MNANISWIPRADSANVTAVHFSEQQLGQWAHHADGSVSIGQFGQQLLDDTVAINRCARIFANVRGVDPQNPAAWQPVKDAAADFLVSGLERVLGPSQTIIRGVKKPWLFVARDGRTPIIPSQNLLTPGWRTVSYKVEAPTGQAQWTEPHSVRKLTHVDYLQTKKEHKAEYYGVKWGYTVPELWEGEKLNEDVIAKKSNYATLALDKFQERTTGWGDSNLLIPGMFTLGDALLSNGGAPFSSGSVDGPTMMRRIQAFHDLYYRANEEMPPTQAVIPRADKSAMQQTYFGDVALGESVWERASRQFEFIRNAQETERLSTGSADGTAPRWVIWSAETEDELYNEHTPTMVFGPFQDYMNIEFVLLRRQGGVVNKRPERVLYVDFNG